MKLPRDLSGSEPAKKLSLYVYRITVKRGATLADNHPARHHDSQPPYLRVGTLTAILNDAAQHLEMSKDELIAQLFEK